MSFLRYRETSPTHLRNVEPSRRLTSHGQRPALVNVLGEFRDTVSRALDVLYLGTFDTRSMWALALQYSAGVAEVRALPVNLDRFG